VVLAEASQPAVQALIRWDPVSFAEHELAERTELGFPPAVRMASITGPPEAIADFVTAARLPSQAEVLGPVPVEDGARGARGVWGGGQPPHEQGGSGGDIPSEASRALIRIGRGDGLALARALHDAQATRSARKDGGVIRVQLDPAEVA
jgi:primosomal protein N' (replication factor Y)